MKTKTSELTGNALDRAVAKALEMHVWPTRGGWFTFDSDAYPEYRNDYNDDKLQSFRPAINWAQGGAIIERERICLEDAAGMYWVATMLYQNDDDGRIQTSEEQGATPLVAAMRCYVASKLGDEVEIPKGLI